MFSSPSPKRLLPASWTSKGILPCPEKNLNDGVTWVVDLGNPIEWQVGNARYTTRELWYGEKTQNLMGVFWVRIQRTPNNIKSEDRISLGGWEGF